MTSEARYKRSRSAAKHCVPTCDHAMNVRCKARLKLLKSLSHIENRMYEGRRVKRKLKRKKKCGLCFREYSVVNLVLSVPHKAIVDMQNTWTEKNSEWIHMDDTQKKLYQNPTKQHAPALYDEVRVCVYCAQFFQV